MSTHIIKRPYTLRGEGMFPWKDPQKFPKTDVLIILAG